MNFEEKVHYRPEKSWLNLGSNLEVQVCGTSPAWWRYALFSFVHPCRSVPCCLSFDFSSMFCLCYILQNL